MDKQRIEYFDVMRGVAIIFVIAIHSFRGFDINENNTPSYHLAIVWRQIIGCAVPIFLAISGYFLAKKDVCSEYHYFSFIKKQVPRVYVPMLIWSIPYLLLSIFTGEDIGISIILFLVGGFSVYYFVALIVQYYLLLPFLQKLGKKTIGLIISALVSVACMIILFYLTHVQDVSLPLMYYAGLFPVWIIFFVLGIYLGNNDQLLISRKKLLFFTLLGLLISIAETYLHIYMSVRFQGLGIKLGAFIYSFFAILFLFSMQTDKSSNLPVWQFLVYLGRISFGVYLTHLFFLIYLVKPIVNRLGIYNYFVEQGLIISLTILCSVVFISGIRKLNKTWAIKYLGF